MRRNEQLDTHVIPLEAWADHPDLVLLDEDQAAAIIGWSTSTLQKDRGRMRRVPFVKLGRRVMYRLSDLRNFIERNVR
jgi:hypothetical protein